MLYFKIGFENGDSFETGFNGTLDEARRYYLGNVFNLGAVDDDMQRCNSVEQLPTLKWRWPRGLRPVAWWCSRMARYPAACPLSLWMMQTCGWWWMAGKKRFTCLWWMPTTWTDGTLTTTAKPFYCA